jgi:hypothetical protein
MTGITPRLPGRLVHSHRPLKTFYLARHYSKYSTLLYYLLVVCVCVYLRRDLLPVRTHNRIRSPR